MLAQELKCPDCSELALKSLKRVIYPEGKNASTSKPEKLIFQIVCRKCGVSQVIETAKSQ